MIVNPSQGALDRQRSERFFLGDDGTLYRTSLEKEARPGKGARQRAARQIGGYFLGADGTLYEVVE